MFVRKREGCRDIYFDGILFAVEEEKKLDCQYGKHYFKQKDNCEPNKKSRLRLQGTRKIGCMANITVKSYLLYPQYTLKGQKNKCMSTRKLKQLQEETLSKLREALKTDALKVEVVRKYFVSLPTEDAHSGHPTGKCTSSVSVNVSVSVSVSMSVSV